MFQKKNKDASTKGNESHTVSFIEAYLNDRDHLSSAAMASELREAVSLSDFLSANFLQMRKGTSIGYLNALLSKKGMKRADIVRAGVMNEAFIYEIFKGKKKPSRDKLLLLTFVMKLSEDETQELLKRFNYSTLSSRNERDAVILYAVQRGLTLEYTEEQLQNYDLESLFSKDY